MFNALMRRVFGLELIGCDHIEDIRDALDACCETLYWVNYKGYTRLSGHPPEDVAKNLEEAKHTAEVLLKPLGMWPSLPKHRLGPCAVTLARRAVRDARRQKAARGFIAPKVWEPCPICGTARIEKECPQCQYPTIPR